MMRNVSIVLLLSVLSANAFAAPEIATWPEDDLMQENKIYTNAATYEHLGSYEGPVTAKATWTVPVPAGKYLPKRVDTPEDLKDCPSESYCPGNTEIGYFPNLTTDQGIEACPIGTTSSGGASSIQDCVAPTITKIIIYNVNGGTACENEEYTVGVLKTLDCNTTKTGYVFKGWFMSSDLSGSAVTEIPTSATEDKELYAKWTAQEYTIDYVMNNGTNYNDAPTSYTIESATINLGTPTRTGYTFSGWYASSDFSSNAVTQITKGSTGDKTLYAKWTPNTYNIIYKDSNTVLSDLGPTKYTYGTNTTINAIPIKTGYVFEGWFNSANGGSEVKNINETETGDIILYAHWKMTANMCTKGTYLSEDTQSCAACPTEYPDSSDGAESVSECYKDIATTCIQTEGPVPTNCSGVTEWNECSCTGTYKQYADTRIVGATTEECTKTAKSLEAPLGYYVSGTTCLACASKPDNAEYTDSDNCAWACNAHYEKSDDVCITCSSKNTTEIESVTGGTRTRSVTYDNNASGSSCSASYGEWNYSCDTGYTYVSGNSCTANTYNIIYKDGDTVLSDLGPTKYTYGANMPINATPAKTGYVFEGWFTSATGGKKLVTVPSTLSQNIVVYARWSLKEYSITYHLNGGVNNVNNPETYSIHTPTITLKTPSKEWYDFEGWYDNDEFTGEEITSISKEAQKDVHLYAKWKVHDCSVGEYRGYSTCEICPENTYCPGDNTKYNCPSGSVSPAGSSKADSCGILLNIGSEKLYLTPVQETHPALAVRFNGKVYYAQTTPLTEGIKPMNKDTTEQMILKLDNQKYSIHDNTIKGEL